MNIIRLIKLKQLNGDFVHLDEKEKLFFSLFNNLYYVKDNDVVFLFNEKEYYFKFDLKNNVFWYNYSKVWIFFKYKYILSYNETKELIEHLLKTHLNLVMWKFSMFRSIDSPLLEKYHNMACNEHTSVNKT